MRRIFSVFALLILVAAPLSPVESWADVPEVSQRFLCSTQNTTEEPLKDGTCDRYTLASGSYQFKTCTYRSYGTDIANSSDGLFRLNVTSANTAGFQTSRTMEIDVHLQENCASSFNKSAYVVGGLVTGNKGTRFELTNPKVTHNWRPSNISLLPAYCGFRSCADSVHSFKVELPEDTDFYTITLFFADSATGLTNGLANVSAIFGNIILRSAKSYDPNTNAFSLKWNKTENGHQCEITTELNRQQLWDAGVREMRLFGSAGPSEGIQTKGPNLGVSFKNPATSSLSSNGTLPHPLGLFKYNFAGPSTVSNEYFEMSSQLVYVCKAWVTTVSGASRIVSASFAPSESFAKPIPVVPVQKEIPDNWVKVKWISAFAGSSKSLSKSQQNEARDFLRTLPESGEVTCSAYYSYPNTQARSNLARSRAKAVCDFAKKLQPSNSYSFLASYTGSKKLNGQVFVSGKQG